VGGVTDDVQRRERERAVASRNAWGDLAARMRDGDIPMSCTRPRDPAHRVTDSRLPADPEREFSYRSAEGDIVFVKGLPPGPWVCGVCHQPPPGLEVELRVDVERAQAA
jgi:hypothetical protein